jgi:four helix bundle protein
VENKETPRALKNAGGGKMKPHKKLNVWKKAIEFVTKIYKITKSFPDHEKFVLVPQIWRSAISIPSNIAEGAGRLSKKEFIQFLSIAQGSTSELETQLIISNNLGFLREEDMHLLDELDEISRMIIGLIRTLKK